MRTLTSAFGKFCASCLLLGTIPSLFAEEVVLQKLPDIAATQSAKLGPQASFALVNYNLRDQHSKARALYVSSGNDLAQAGNMLDDQATTSFGFSTEDNAPTAVIDLGKSTTLRRLSAIYSAKAGAIDFYVMQSLPGTKAGNAPDSLKVDSTALATLKPVGSAIDDGTQGRATIDFPAATGRYVMLRWHPASHGDTPFTVAEITASGPGREKLVASSGNFTGNQITSDGKDIADAKDMGDSKDVPAEGPPADPPAEGPPPLLPNPPPFTFIPQLVPVSE